MAGAENKEATNGHAFGTPIYTLEIAATDPGRRQRVVGPHLRLARPSRKHAAIAPKGPQPARGLSQDTTELQKPALACTW